MQKIKDYLKIKEAATFLGICNGTLRNWADKKIIPEYRYGKKGYRLFKKEDLEVFLSRIESNNNLTKE